MKALLKVPVWMAKMPVINRFALKNTPKAEGGKKLNDLSVKIIQEFKNNSQQGIDTWRQALDSADDPKSPKWDMLQDLYDYLRVDAHTHSLIELRKSAILGKRFYVYDKLTGEENPEKTALLKSKWFYDFLSEVLDAQPNGYTVLVITDLTNITIKSLPRRNYVPQKNFLRFKTSEDNGVYLDEPAVINTVIVVKSSYMYGYMNDLVPSMLWKKNAMQAWAEFAEKYAIPALVAISKKSDEKTLGKIDEILKGFGQTLTATLPDGVELVPLNLSNNSNAEKIFNEQIERCNSEISKRIVGGTMITDNGSSKSQSEVHQANFDEKIIENDAKLCEFTVTDQLLPKLFSLGFSENDAFAFDRSEEIDLKTHWDIVRQAAEMYEIDTEWVKKTFQLPITGNKAAPPSAAPAPGKKNKTASFNTAFNELAASLKAKDVMLPHYVPHGTTKNITAVSSGLANILEELSSELINDVFAGKETLLNEVLKAIATYSEMRDGMFDSWGERRLKTGYDATDHHCLASMEYNIFEFSRMKEKANVFALNELLIDKDTNNVRPFNDFKTKALDYLRNPDMNWLKTEYNHSIAVGQNASRYHQFVSEQDTVTNLVQWQTVGDDRVRASHQAMEGRVFDLKEKGGLTIWPPKDWGCRCEMVQYTGTKKSVTTNEEGLKLLKLEKGSKWAVNRGATEQVFTANEMYMKNTGLADESAQLTYEKYGLQKFADIKDKYDPIKLDTTITPANVNELFKTEKDKDYMGFTDYLDRKLVMTQEVFDLHTQGKYVKPSENRHQLFPHVTDVLNKPDEVYIFENKKGSRTAYQTDYIKFYNDMAIVVNTGIGSNNVEINTWYIMKGDEAKTRYGYLIQRKKP